MMKKTIMSLVVCLCLSSLAFGNGYQVLLQGHRQTAMGNNGVALTGDAASLFFNPGAMGFEKQKSLMLGVSAIFGKAKYIGPGTATFSAETDNPFSTPFFAYFTYGISEKLTVGVGVFTPYGSSIKWGDNWSGRLAIDELTLRSIFFQPTVSYKINDKISVGAGLDIVVGSVNLQRPTFLRNGDTNELIRTELDGSADMAFGFNLGVYAKPIEQLSVGINYRSRVDMKVSGGDFISDAPAGLASLFPETTFDAELPLPSVLTIGVAVKPTSKLTLTGEASFVGWSAYKELKFTFADPVGGATEQVAARKYHDTQIYRIGAEYMLGKIALRAGAYYDESPVPDGYVTPETPDSDSYAATAGLGFKLGEKFNIDTYFLFIHRVERENEAKIDAGNVSGTYQARVAVAGLSLSFDLGN